MPILRTGAILGLVVGLFLALPGCRKREQGPLDTENIQIEPERKPEPKPETKVTPKPAPPTEPTDDPTAERLTPLDTELNSPAAQEVMAVLKAFQAGRITPDHLSTGLLKMVGQPLVSPEDQARGYNADAVAGWLKRNGNWEFVSRPSGYAGADAIVAWGSIDRTGDLPQDQYHLRVVKMGGELSPKSDCIIRDQYHLRMVKEDGFWKVDYLALSSVRVSSEDYSDLPQAGYAVFTARTTAALLCENEVTGKEDRAAMIAAVLAPTLRAKWAAPSEADRAGGYSDNRTALLAEASKFGGMVKGATVTRQGSQIVYRLEVVKTEGSNLSLLVKLVKGKPGQWLVESIKPQ